MTRRSAVILSAAIAAGPSASGSANAPAAGRLKQSFARWCYRDIPIEDLCRQAAEIGLVGIDLTNPPDWPVMKKYGLTPTVFQGAQTIPVGWNHKENHDPLEKILRDLISTAAANKIPNVITFSGNRKGMNDDEGKANCIEGLRRVSKAAEDAGVTILMELLNSKVNHKDYMADHTAWGVDVMKGVGSPNVKLLYDIYHMQIMEGDIIRTVRQNIAHTSATSTPAAFPTATSSTTPRNSNGAASPKPSPTSISKATSHMSSFPSKIP